MSAAAAAAAAVAAQGDKSCLPTSIENHTYLNREREGLSSAFISQDEYKKREGEKKDSKKKTHSNIRPPEEVAA